MLRWIYIVVTLTYGSSLYALSWAPSVIPWDLTVPAFLVSVVMTIPGCLAFGRFEIWYDGPGPTPPDIQQNNSDLSFACRWWPGIYYATLVLIAVNWLGFFLGLSTHPFYAFSGGIVTFVGCWFLFVHRTALELFASNPPQ